MAHNQGGATGHSHDHPAGANAKMLGWALALTSSYLVAEVVGGFWFSILALLSDAAHMMTNVAALVIALMAIKLGQKAPDYKRTFGYRRFEILAAAVNAVLLFAIAIFVFVEAVKRFSDPEPVQSLRMLIVAAIGLVVNLILMRLLTAGKDASFNVKGAYLEAWADMIGSIGVILGALAIQFTGWTWIDPVVAVAIGLWASAGHRIRACRTSSASSGWAVTSSPLRSPSRLRTSGTSSASSTTRTFRTRSATTWGPRSGRSGI